MKQKPFTEEQEKRIEELSKKNFSAMVGIITLMLVLYIVIVLWLLVINEIILKAGLLTCP